MEKEESTLALQLRRRKVICKGLEWVTAEKSWGSLGFLPRWTFSALVLGSSGVRLPEVCILCHCSRQSVPYQPSRVTSKEQR